MPGQYEIDVSRDDGKTYGRVAGSWDSLDRAKSVARDMRKSGYGGHRTNLRFRIYSANGERLVLENDTTRGGWRMVWLYGDLRPRREQSGSMSDA